MNTRHRSRAALVTRGVGAGLLGGLAAAWVMDQFQAGLSKLSSGNGEESGSESDANATVNTAQAISQRVFDHTLTDKEKQQAAPGVHYAFAASMGALYGALAELQPRVTRGWGMPFGAGLWLGADEVAVPALGLGPSATETPVSTHASALAAHLVYGLSVDLVRRAVMALDSARA